MRTNLPATPILVRLGTTLIGLLLGLPLAVRAHSPDKTIIWAAIELPPIVIFSTSSPTTLKELGNGSSDVAIRALAAHLPGMEHKVFGASTKRVVAEMSAGKPLCVGALLMSAEANKLMYLTPRGITPPHHLVVRKSDLQRITGGATSVSLAKLLTNESLTGIIDASRPLGKGIDELIAKPFKQLKRAQYTHATPQYSSLLKSVDTGESDYALELPYVMEYYNRKKVLVNELVAVPFDEAREADTVYVGCTRSPWGAKMIRELDTAIRAAVKDDKNLRNALLYWLPESLQAEYSPLLDAYFKKRLNEPPPVTE